MDQSHRVVKPLFVQYQSKWAISGLSKEFISIYKITAVKTAISEARRDTKRYAHGKKLTCRLNEAMKEDILNS